MQAMHGGTAKNATIDSPKMAALLRGGMLPQAYVYPAAMRATRDLVRRRTCGACPQYYCTISRASNWHENRL